jgi:hypothetical protein
VNRNFDVFSPKIILILILYFFLPLKGTSLGETASNKLLDVLIGRLFRLWVGQREKKKGQNRVIWGIDP